jgi:hypothetical protein
MEMQQIHCYVCFHYYVTMEIQQGYRSCFQGNLICNIMQDGLKLFTFYEILTVLFLHQATNFRL